MNDAEYKEYLQTEEWKRIAQKRMEIDGFRCVACGCRGTARNPLECHHLSYNYIGREESRIYQDLVTLCHVCHKNIHQIMNRVTAPNGRRGWQDRHDIPTIHVYNLSGTNRDFKEVKP